MTRTTSWRAWPGATTSRSSSNLVKVTLVQESLVVSAEHHHHAEQADLHILTPLSINHILQAVQFFFESWQSVDPEQAGQAGEAGPFGLPLDGQVMGEFVRLEVADGIATMRIDRPKMNALNVQVQDEIRAAALEATDATDIKAVIVYGGEKRVRRRRRHQGDAGMSYTDMVDRSVPLQASFTAVARIPKPVIAAITGYALGGGCEPALACDFRVVGRRCQARAARDRARSHPGCRWHAAAGAPGRPSQGQGDHLQRPPRRAGVARHRAGRQGRPGRRRLRGCARVGSHSSAPTYALRAPKEAVDRGLEVDSRPVSRSSGCCSPGCSPRGTAR